MKLTLFYLYYNNLPAIKQLEAIGYPDYPVEILIVDDGSTVPLKLDWPNVTVIRIKEDIPWNMSAANNLGFRALDPESVVLRMDIDHYITAEGLKVMIDYADRLQDNCMMKFRRLVYRKFDQYSTPAPPNIFLAKVKDLLNAGGYDERFCGHYGYEDKELMWRLARKGMKLIPIKEELIHCTEFLGTKGLDRDAMRNLKLYQEITAK